MLMNVGRGRRWFDGTAGINAAASYHIATDAHVRSTLIRGGGAAAR